MIIIHRVNHIPRIYSTYNFYGYKNTTISLTERKTLVIHNGKIHGMYIKGKQYDKHCPISKYNLEYCYYPYTRLDSLIKE